MVHLESIRRMEEFYEAHKDEILASGHRFAVVETGNVSYFDSRDDLYKAHPYFNPQSPRLIGQLPRLVDIGKETNSREFRLEKLDEDKKRWDNDLVELLERHDSISKREDQLRLE